MTNWTPSTIYQQAHTIADLAKQIDSQIWYAHRHGVHQTEAYNRDLQDKSRELQLRLAEFKMLDTTAILLELREALK